MRILYVEPFEGGSHAAFGQSLRRGVEADWTPITLPARHWKWRMRGVAPYLSLAHRELLQAPYDLILASSYVPLAELKGLVPRLAPTPSLLYFHENQLCYPLRPGLAPQERDHHFGFTQLVSALAASRVVFNSEYNRSSFLEAGAALVEAMPDAHPPGWLEQIRGKSLVLPVPLELPDLGPEDLIPSPRGACRASGPIILWNHRWEHDKNPEGFFGALEQLKTRGIPFRLAVCGEQFRGAPRVFERARKRFSEHIVHWGFAPERSDYEQLLRQAHIAVSTARHEFFGMAMLEATWFGARPLVPSRLVYPELFPADMRYAEDEELVDVLESMIGQWVGDQQNLRQDRRALVERFRSAALLPAYASLFNELRAA